jgi:hypothetical protein
MQILKLKTLTMVFWRHQRRKGHLGENWLHSLGELCSQFWPNTAVTPENHCYAFWALPLRHFASGGLLLEPRSMAGSFWGFYPDTFLSSPRMAQILKLKTVTTVFRQN